MEKEAVLRHALRAPGDVLDIGCHTGGSLLWAVEQVERCAPEKGCWGFDGYGLMEVCSKDGESAKQRPDMFCREDGGVQSVCEQRIREWHDAHDTRVHLVIGRIGETFKQWVDTQMQPWCWVHFGTGCYIPTRAVLTWVPARLSVGGIIWSDNWENSWFGETAAVQEFLALHPGYTMTGKYIEKVSEWHI